MGRLEAEKGQDFTLLVCIEPVQIPARALTRVMRSACQPVEVTLRQWRGYRIT